MSITGEQVDCADAGFDARVVGSTGGVLRAGDSIKTIQVNIGLTCNLACRHCHVESGPKRLEQMDRATMVMVLDAAKRSGAETIDITGGAPEMMEGFRWFVDEALALGLRVMVRTNLTIMLEDGYEDLPGWYAERGVQLVASLPCYLEENVDKQRGLRVYEKSVEVVRRLNAVGYGVEDRLVLDLVYNPGGPSVAPDQVALEADYRRELGERLGITFTSLFCITNVAIGRFLHDLKRDGKAEEYERKLREAFNPSTVEGLMCRHQVHVSYDGSLHDCDFNYAIGMRCVGESRGHIRDFDTARMVGREVATGEHCFACTAGAGSSCGGALVGG